MTIQVDTREHASEWNRIQKQFDELGIQYVRSKLYVGDYMSLDNARLVIDRKKDLQELCGNVCQQHERFKKELIRAMQAGIQIIFLVVSVLTFATSSTWGISTIVIPIIIPLAAAVDANLILTMAAILSGSTFGSHACFYSDATVLASAASRIENMEHAFTQIPYAAVSAALACVCFLVSGFVMG